MEWLVWVCSLTPPLFLGTWYSIALYRKPSRNEAQARETLSSRDRSDIYRDMAWWDREFRKLCGEPEPTNQLSDSMNQAIEALRNFGLVPTVEEIKPVNNITYLYNPEKDYQAEMKRAFNK